MRILITGSSGFIGRALCTEMNAAGHDVFGFDLAISTYQNVCDEVEVHKAMAKAEPDVVVHLAAEVGKLNCEQNSERAIKTNVYGTMSVARACSKAEIPLVFVSTSEVYGNYGVHDVDELTPLTGKPSGTYALTKRWGEEVCETYALEGLKILRPTMPYGPGVPPGPGRRALDNFVDLALRKQPITVHHVAARSWCWIDDLAAGMRVVVERGEPGVYNVGRDDDEVLMETLAHDIIEMCGARPHSIEVIDVPARQTGIKRISCAKLRALGWEPKVSRDEGIPRVIEWVERWQRSQS